jgi:hypothetical protein
VDPGATCGDDDNASTRGLRIETSSNGTTFTTVANTTFSAAQAHQLVNVTPTSKPKKVRVLRVTMLSNLNPNAGSGQNFMDLSEVAIYGKPSDLIKPVISNVSIPTGQTIRSMSGAAGFKIRAKLSEAGTMKGPLTIPSTKTRQLGIPAQIGTGTLGFLKAGLKTNDHAADAKGEERDRESAAPRGHREADRHRQVGQQGDAGPKERDAATRLASVDSGSG